MAGREGEGPALNQSAMTRSQVLREPMYSRLLGMYRRGAHGGGNICLSKLPGVDPGDVQLALEGSRPDNVLCPEGFRMSLAWPFCCVRNGREPPVETHFTPYTDYEPGRKQRKGMGGERNDPRDDEDDSERIYGPNRFGEVYRKIRPHASDELVAAKYNAYLRVLSRL